MKLTDNTVLITGGSTGIGLEFAKQLAEQENKVIICGRSKEKLEHAKRLVPPLKIIQSDITQDVDRRRLKNIIKEKYPECNLLVNNAAVVHKTEFAKDPEIVSKLEHEIQTNYIAPIKLTKMFLRLLNGSEKKSSIIYITSGLVYTPKSAYPIYSSTKAGLHSFVQTLRAQIQALPIDIVEVLMPPVDTPFHKGFPPDRAISTDKAVSEMLDGLRKGKEEIRVGVVKLLYLISRVAPSLAMKMINK